MSFGAPLNLLWLIPALGALALLYILRRPRRTVIAPSTLLWKMMPSASPRASRLQRLTPELLLFLQILAILLLIAAAAQPRTRQTASQGRAWVIIVDNGATMNATDVPGGRAVQASEFIASFIDQLPRGDRICEVTTSAGAKLARPLEPVGAYTTQGGALPSTDAPSDIVGAVQIAAQVLQPDVKAGRAGGIILLTDAAWPPSLDSAVRSAAGPIAVELAGIGSPSAADIGITRLAVERDPADPDQRRDVFAEVRSTAATSASFPLQLDEDGAVIASKTLTLPPNGSSSAVFTLPAPARETILRARITPNGDDDLSDNDTAYAVLPAAGATRVLLVSDGDPPLERALSLLPGTQVDEAGISAYERVGAPSSYDVIVLDGAAPRPADLSRNLLIWGGAGPGFGAPVAESSSPIVDWDRSHPAMRFLDFGDLGSLDAPAWPSVGDLQPILETGQGVVAAAQDQDGARAIWLSFAPAASGFSAQAAFPIFISNAIGWLAERAGQTDTAGTPIALAPITGGWKVSGPSVDQSGLCTGAPGSSCDFGGTLRAGAYTAIAGDQRLLFARNVDPGAVDLRPQAHDLPSVSAPSAAFLPRAPIWSSLIGVAAALCLLALVVEWWIYHRPRRRTVARVLN